jgi:uncharacterized protein
MQAPNPTIVIAGGSGFLGRSIARAWSPRAKSIVLLSRHPASPIAPNVRSVAWDARTLGPWADEVRGAEVVINLAGRSVDCIKTADHRDEILRSRVESTLVLGRAMQQAAPPALWIQMSTAHAYGDPPDAVCEEDSAFGTGLAPEVARAWEAAFDHACPIGTRRVILRTSFVLGRDGGALPRLARLARLGVGGTISHGRQGISWIHGLDFLRMIDRAVDDPAVQGPYLATSPHPVSNAEFMRELRRALRVPFGLPATEWMVRLGAPLLLRTDPELALYGRYCVSTRWPQHRFEFSFPRLHDALRDLYSTNIRKASA